MKNITKSIAIAVFLGAGLMSCSMVEGFMGEGTTASPGGFLDTLGKVGVLFLVLERGSTILTWSWQLCL